MRTLTFHPGGIHPPENKTAPADKIIWAELPLVATLPLRQHIGAEAIPVVAKGDKVTRGQMVAKANGPISASVHTPITGTVKNIADATLSNGRSCKSVIIEATEEEHKADEQARRQAKSPIDYSKLTPKEIIGKIAEAGIVGMGGATFPTAAKLSPPAGCKAEVLLINASECEPRLTCDDALMRAYPAQIIEGAEIMRKAANVAKAIIGIENNKPQALEALQKAAAGKDGIEIALLKTKYPEGGEKQLIKAITGKEVPSGQLPISVGAIVQNVATAFAAYQAVALDTPLIERVATIDGCGNYMCAIGMPICDIPATAETRAEADVIAGGPMMGTSAIDLSAPVTKGFSGISVCEPLTYDPQPCIRCAACVDACPMGLEPYLIAAYSRKGMIDEAKAECALDCIECGSCNYSCPSARPILDYIRVAKRKILSTKK